MDDVKDRRLRTAAAKIMATVMLVAVVLAYAGFGDRSSTSEEASDSVPKETEAVPDPSPEPTPDSTVDGQPPTSEAPTERGSSSRPGSQSGASSRPQPGAVQPVAGGVERRVANMGEWSAAVSAARPGDVIRLVANMSERLVYRGDNDGGNATGAHGTPEAPIVITADPGVWIDVGNVASNFAGIDIFYVDNVHVVGIGVRNAQFGIRCLQCHGTPDRPVRIVNNEFTNIGYVGIHVGGHLKTHAASTNVLVEGNNVSHTGKLTARFGEGIYIGHGYNEWVDETSNITVRGNEVSHTTAEAIDIKPGTRDIVVEDNLIHHAAPIDGGSISAHYVHSVPNPKPDELDRLIVRNNRIWNQNLDGVPGASDAAIWVGHGGVEITGNVIWGFRIHPNSRAVRVRSPQTFGPYDVVIADNVFWVERGWVADGWPLAVDSVAASGNKGPSQQTAEVVVGANDFPGPVPPIGQGGDADTGGGPGSALSVFAPSPTPEGAPDPNAGGDELQALPAPAAAPPAAAPPVAAPAVAAAPPATTTPAAAPPTASAPAPGVEAAPPAGLAFSTDMPDDVFTAVPSKLRSSGAGAPDRFTSTSAAADGFDSSSVSARAGSDAASDADVSGRSDRSEAMEADGEIGSAAVALDPAESDDSGLSARMVVLMASVTVLVGAGTLLAWMKLLAPRSQG